MGAKYTKQEWRVECGMDEQWKHPSNQEISMAVSRKHLILIDNKLIDEQDEKNVAFKIKFLKKKEKHLGEITVLDSPAEIKKQKPGPKTDFDKSNNDSSKDDPKSIENQREKQKEVILPESVKQEQLYKNKKSKLEIEILEKKKLELDLKNAKTAGTLVPYDGVNKMLTIHLANLIKVFNLSGKNYLMEIGAAAKMDPESLSYWRKKWTETVNKSGSEA